MKKIAIATAAALALAGSSAFAVTAQSGFFLTAGAGLGILASPFKNFSGYNYEARRGGFAWQGGIGYEQALNQNFSVGLEVNYIQPGTASLHVYNNSDTYKADIKQHGWQALANATYLWNNGFNVFVKAGAARLKQTYSNVNMDASLNSTTQTKFTAGLGLGYEFSNNLDLSLSWMHTFGKDYSDFTKDVAMWTNSDSITPGIMRSNVLMLSLVYNIPNNI